MSAAATIRKIDRIRENTTYQLRKVDSENTGVLPTNGNARWVALTAWSQPKCPNSAEASEHPSVLVTDFGCYPHPTFPILKSPNRPGQYARCHSRPGRDGSAHIYSKGGGSTPNC